MSGDFQYVMAIEGLKNLPDFDELGEEIDGVRRKVVNSAADRARTLAERAIREQVAFPASYLRPSEGRLTVAKRATSTDPEAVIRARRRATSLARFVRGAAATGKKGLVTEVKPGVARKMSGAFLMKLKAGSADIDTRHNLGLAVRLKEGERVRNKKRFVKLDANLYLLYGPSVDQVFRTVRGDISPDVEAYMEREFLRLVNVEDL